MVAALTVFGWTGVDERMGPYEALAHTFTTLPTGGFSTRAQSLAEFGAASQWTVSFFMALAGANFALLYAAFVRRRGRALARDEEFRLYFLLLALGSGLVFAELASEGIHEGEAAARHAVFQAVSMMTTTGAASADFATWTPLAQPARRRARSRSSATS